MTTAGSNAPAAKIWSHWFEIPVEDIVRAKRFYDAIFATEIAIQDFGSFKMGVFPHGDVGCALCQGQHYRPHADGVLVYMDASPDLQVVLDRVADAGGRVVAGKKQISPEHGFMALFVDTEGNRLALHSMA